MSFCILYSASAFLKFKVADSVVVFEAGDEISFNQQSSTSGDPRIHFRIHRLPEAKLHQQRQEEQNKILQDVFESTCSQDEDESQPEITYKQLETSFKNLNYISMLDSERQQIDGQEFNRELLRTPPPQNHHHTLSTSRLQNRNNQMNPFSALLPRKKKM